MTDETEITATNWRARAATAWGWVTAHPQITIPAATFLLGVAVGWALG